METVDPSFFGFYSDDTGELPVENINPFPVLYPYLSLDKDPIQLPDPFPELIPNLFMNFPKQEIQLKAKLLPTLSEQLNVILHKRGITLKELSNEFGLSRSTLFRVQKGERIKLGTAGKIQNAYLALNPIEHF